MEYTKKYTENLEKRLELFEDRVRDAMDIMDNESLAYIELNNALAYLNGIIEEENK